jgi:arylsulfatase A
MHLSLRNVLIVLLASPSLAWGAEKPNIVFILADDLGYGDVRASNAESMIPTPNLDALAAGGMRFTDAHTSSSVCTPTRYNLLTGRYAWRTRLQKGVLQGFDPPLIAKDRMTVASLLRDNGYQTACIGKWHLGIEWATKDGKSPTTKPDPISNVDFTKRIANGPTTRGFETFFGISASLDMPPYLFIDGDRCLQESIVVRDFMRVGPADEGFDPADVLSTLTQKTVEYVARQAKADAPFFLYMPLNSPHTPIVPTAEWKGKSGLNVYADFVMQTDACVGEIMKALEEAGVAENTLVFFSSDNGCSPAAKLPELAAKGHHPNAPWRGTKADIFDGGHRVPFLVRWPGHIEAGSTSNELACLGDLMATCADILDVGLPDVAAEDSVSLLPALLGKSAGPLREALVHHSVNGSFAIRQDRWKVALCPDSGGWSDPKPDGKKAQDKGVDRLPPVQLYDFESEQDERRNLETTHPDIVVRLTKLLEQYIEVGRSTPGQPQANDVVVEWRR